MSTLENHHSLIRTRTVSRSISFTPTDDEQSPTHKQTLSVYLSLSQSSLGCALAYLI